jgi:hypothetical protein
VKLSQIHPGAEIIGPCKNIFPPPLFLFVLVVSQNHLAIHGPGRKMLQLVLKFAYLNSGLFCYLFFGFVIYFEIRIPAVAEDPAGILLTC